MKKWALFIIILLVGIAGVSYKFYQAIFSPNVDLNGEDSSIYYLPTGFDFDLLYADLENKKILRDMSSFKRVASLMKFSKIKPGQYELKDGWNNKEFISHLRAGKQKPVNLTFNNIRTLEELAGFFATKFEPDSLSILNYFRQDSVMDIYGKSSSNMLSLFIPNTYQLYWNSSPAKIVERLGNEQKKFYNKERKVKMQELGLSDSEVYTLASIVQKETLVNSEKPRVAGVYINRLKRGQLLQADPTVVFASGDFELRRVLNRHLAIDSPYNTYKYAGLPPGPIAMPDVSTIDAVLDYEKHRYLYFCASPDNSGRHLFAKTLVEHNRNADRYRSYLNKKKIYR